MNQNTIQNLQKLCETLATLRYLSLWSSTASHTCSNFSRSKVIENINELYTSIFSKSNLRKRHKTTRSNTKKKYRHTQPSLIKIPKTSTAPPRTLHIELNRTDVFPPCLSSIYNRNWRQLKGRQFLWSKAPPVSCREALDKSSDRRALRKVNLRKHRPLLKVAFATARFAILHLVRTMND